MQARQLARRATNSPPKPHPTDPVVARHATGAGIVRSKGVKKIDDGCGPTEDDGFTLTVNAMATVRAL